MALPLRVGDPTWHITHKIQRSRHKNPAPPNAIHELKQQAILCQFIIYEPVEIACFIGLIQRGIIDYPAPYVLFVLGKYGKSHPSNPVMLADYLKEWNDFGLRMVSLLHQTASR